MKIVFLTPQLPYPPQSGGVIKSFQLVKYLSKNHELVVGTFLKGDDPLHLSHFRKEFPLINLVTLPIDIPRTPLNFLWSLLQGIPLTVLRNKSEEFQKKIDSFLNEAELIFVDHYIMFQYVPEEFRGKVILHEHNAEYLLWLRYAEQSRNPLKKLLLTFESLRIRRYEKEIGIRADHILASPNDKEELMKLGLPTSKFVLTWHLGSEEWLDKPDLEFSKTKKVLLNVGTLSWEPNRDGLKWFIAEVWPKLKIKHQNLELWIAGKGADAQLHEAAKSDEQIKLLGFVDDLEKLHLQTRVFIAPLRFGSGIKVKVINALYRGLPVVTTSIGVEGMEVTPSQHLFVSDESESMIESIDLLLKDEDTWNKMSRSGRSLVRSHYTWKKVFDELEKIL